MRARLYGLGRPLAMILLLVAAADAALYPFAQFTELLTQDQLQRALYASAFALGVGFLRALLDPAARRAINAANVDLRGSEGHLRWRWISPLDPTWGLTGSRLGRGLLPVLRGLLIAEFVVGLLLSALGGAPPPALFTCVGLALCGVLTLTQLKDHYGAPGDDEAR